MGNTILTPQIIAKEALLQLKNNTVMSNLVYRDYENEFVAGVGNTVTIRKPATFEAKEFNRTTGIEIQDATEGAESVKLDKLLDVSFEVTAEQLSLDIADFSTQLLQPAMQSFAQKIDSYLLGLYKDVSNTYGTAGTTPNDIGAITGARKILNETKTPFDNRSLVIDPSAENNFLQIPTFHEAGKVGDNGTSLSEASLGRKFGFGIYTDQNVATHTAGTLSAGTGKIKPKADTTKGETTITVGATTLTGSVIVGDVVVVLDKTYTVTAAATAESNEITFNITPALMDDITTSTEITVTAGHVANLAFHKNAFALVTRPLALPKGLSSEQKAIVNYDGFGLRVIYDYNSQFKKDVISIDMLCGVKTLNPELACRLLG